MTSSIDGRQLLSRWTRPAAGIDPAVLRRHSNDIYLRLGVDGWIVGRRTMAEYATGTARGGPADTVEPGRNHFADRRGRALAVAIDPGGKLHYGNDEVEGDHFVALLGEGVEAEYLAELRADGVSYVFAGPDGSDLAGALDAIGEAFGIRSLLLQGGGTTNGMLLKAGLIDEISLLIYPGIDGLAGVAAFFEFPGEPDERPAGNQALRHMATEALAGGTVWIRYQVESAP